MLLANDPAALDAAAARWRRWNERGSRDRADKIEGEVRAALASVIEREAGRLSACVGLQSEDLELAGAAAVGYALAGYDPTSPKATTFEAYARICIRKQMLLRIRTEGSEIREPLEHRRRRLAIETAKDQLKAKTGETPTLAEIARKTGLSEVVVQDVLSCASVLPTVRFDAMSDIGESDTTDPEFDPAFGEDFTAATDARLQIALYFERFDQRDRAILRARFYDRKTLHQVADILGCHYMTVWKAERRILQTLRQHLSDEATDDIELETPALRRLLTEENLLRLPELQARVIRCFYFEARPFDQVAAELDLTVSDVVNLRRRALETLQHLASADV